jgi:hypothetical protein
MIQAPEAVEKSHPIILKAIQKVSKPRKCQNIYNKAQIESPKYRHQTTFETLKYLNKPCFEHA